MLAISQARSLGVLQEKAMSRYKPRAEVEDKRSRNTSAREKSVTDRVQRSTNGRPLKLARKFDKVIFYSREPKTLIGIIIEETPEMIIIKAQNGSVQKI